MVNSSSGKFTFYLLIASSGMLVDTQFIITCSTLGITLYLSEANQVYSLSHLTIA